jgi:hypothetical protein
MQRMFFQLRSFRLFASDLIRHLKVHIRNKTVITCPFQGCEKQFSGVSESTFKSHLSRYHRNWSRFSVSAKFFLQHEKFDKDGVASSSHQNLDSTSDCCLDVTDEHASDDATESLDLSTFSAAAIEKVMTRNLAQFMLSLQAKHHVPADTVQKIVVEFANLHHHNVMTTENKIKKILNQANMTQDLITKIIASVKSNPLSVTMDAKDGLLRSESMRATFFKTEFNYVEPVSYSLDSTRNIHFHYVPIKQSLKALFQDHAVQSQLVEGIHLSEDECLADIGDGSTCKKNIVLQADPTCLKLLMYQDDFEPSNPLGSAKGKHKMLAVYYTLGNLHPRVRTKIDVVQLILLCKRSSVITYGLDVIFEPLMRDLVSLENDGVDLGPPYGIRKATVMFILGDNLGSHMIGGFTESFSGHYFCRFCMATRDCLTSGQCFPENFDVRTPERYDSAVRHVEENNVDHFEGVKRKSVLHKLAQFHVCNVGLPPCIGHDIFEGIALVDLTLYLSYLTKEKRWFSINYLNRRIEHLKLKGVEAKDRPAFINEQTGKVSGHAVQIWVLIRFLPILVGHKIDDTSDMVWQLVLLLREIVELVCSPKLSTRNVAVMKDIIEEYIEIRLHCFPESSLKPKHHFLTHYPQLTLACGPLIRLWTMRFESKHSYFKKCARSAQNFKNITKTLSVKHQFLQAMYSSGSLFKPSVEIQNGLPLHIELYDQRIRDAVEVYSELTDASRSQICERAVVDNIVYEKGMYVFLDREEGHPVCGEIMYIISHHSIGQFVLAIRRKIQFLPDLGIYSILQQGITNDLWTCVPFNSLLDLLPLSSYNVSGQQFLVLHHYV